MATETLLCETCNENWERELKRGRKPKECPDCKNGTKSKSRPTKPAVNPEVLNEAKKKYKQRVQMKGEHFRTIGEPSTFVTGSGKELTIYKSFELDDGVVHHNTIVREKGMQGRYRFRSLVVREDGTAYANLVGASGTYEGKYRAIGVENLRL